MINRNCQHCSNNFSVTEDDLKFYGKISPNFDGKAYEMPLPTLCPKCREQRRLAFRNERNIYGRKCDLCHKNIVSIYAPSVDIKYKQSHDAEPKSYKVYCQSCWWSDHWNPLDYGKDFDFKRTFFEQFDELLHRVPQLALFNARNENSEYANFSEQDKNSYLVFASNRNEDCYYSSYIWDSKNCMDCLSIEKSELLYECVDCLNCYNAKYSQNCQNCHDMAYCYDCGSCSNVFACAGLRGKSYCILNKQYSVEEYKKELQDPRKVQKILDEFDGLKTRTPRLYAKIINCENVSGAYLLSCSNAHHCYESFDLKDAKYVENNPGGGRDIFDINGSTNTQFGYELVGVVCGYQVAFCFVSLTKLSNSYYCVSCMKGNDLFGCISLNNSQYCILNKQYTKEEYQKLVPKIIEHMQKTGEWGEFFPIAISPFAYNETVAQNFYPLDKEEIIEKKYKWREENYKEYLPQTSEVNTNIGQVTNEITKEVFSCRQCKKNYRIILQELDFYRQMQLELPLKCPDCRYKDMLALRNPRKLWERNCTKCGSEIQTTYRPDRPENVYCGKCYLQEIY